MIYVQFADDTDAVIIAFFSNPQDPVGYPNQGGIESSDPRWKVFFDASPFQMYLPAPTT